MTTFKKVVEQAAMQAAVNANPPECLACQRRTDRSARPLANWMWPPVEMPCPMRIAPQEGE